MRVNAYNPTIPDRTTGGAEDPAAEPALLERDDGPVGIAARAMAYLDAGLAVALVGEAGSGKTTLARQIAACRGRGETLVAGDPAMTSEDLVGREIGTEVHRTRDRFVHSVLKTREVSRVSWTDGPLLTAMSEGTTLVFDEYTRAPPPAHTALLWALEDGRVPVASLARGERSVVATEGFAVILTGNPSDYAGTNAPADALSDRLVHLRMPPPSAAFETAVVAARCGLDDDAAALIVDLVRDRLSAGPPGARRGSLRPAIMLARMVAASGCMPQEGDRTFTAFCDDLLGPSGAMPAPRPEGRPARTAGAGAVA